MSVLRRNVRWILGWFVVSAGLLVVVPLPVPARSGDGTTTSSSCSTSAGVGPDLAPDRPLRDQTVLGTSTSPVRFVP